MGIIDKLMNYFKDDKLYTKREIARKTNNNPNGLGLIQLNYNNIPEKILSHRLGFSDLTITPGGHKKYKFSNEDIIRYNNKYGRQNDE